MGTGRRAILTSAAMLPWRQVRALAADAAAGPAASVTIAIQYGIGYLPVMVADKLGLFARPAAGAPLSVTLTRMSGATAINDALISGSIDVGAYGLPGMLIAREKTLRNLAIRGLCSLSSLPYGLYTNNPAVRTLADIGPADRIAVTAPNTPQAELLRMAARKAFGDARHFDTRMVSLPHPDATAALLAGRGISLYFATPPFSEVLDAAPAVHLVTTSREILGEEITGAMLATTGRFAARPGAADAVVSALAEADRTISADPARAAALYLESEQSRLSAAEVEAILRRMGSLFTVTPGGTMAMAAFMASQDELKSPPARWQDAFYPPVADGKGG